MTNLLVLLQTLRKRLFSIFPDASLVEVGIGGQFLHLRLYWKTRDNDAHTFEHRIPWSILSDHQQPWLVMEDAITRLREAYNS